MTVAPNRSLHDVLKVAGVAAPAVGTPAATPAADASKTAAAAPAAAAPAAAPTKVAATKTAKVQYDPSIIKVAAQQTLMDKHGILCPDPEKAAGLLALYEAQEVQAIKTAEAEKIAGLQEQGRHMCHGILKESAAIELALGKTKLAEVAKLAHAIDQQNGDAVYSEIVKSARIKKQAADGAVAATSSDALFGGDLGSAVRPTSSEAQSAAERNGNTTQFEPAAVSGTRKPVSADPIAGGMSGSVTIPNNPGLNHGQATDNGKGSSGG